MSASQDTATATQTHKVHEQDKVATWKRSNDRRFNYFAHYDAQTMNWSLFVSKTGTQTLTYRDDSDCPSSFPDI